jgi:(p)ppGpp synthase/HD superfamily hydrolase
MNWKEFSAHVRPGLGDDGLKQLKPYFDIAMSVHDGEKRDGGKPYSDHPPEAAIIAYNLGERDLEVFKTVLTHDIRETLRKFGKEYLWPNIATKLGTACAARVTWMTKEGQNHKERARSLKLMLEHRDRVVFKAKCWDRLHNVESFDDMLSKDGESKETRIRRKVTETVEVFGPVLRWLEADIKTGRFKNEKVRDAEQKLLQNMRQAFVIGLAKYGAEFK